MNPEDEYLQVQLLHEHERDRKLARSPILYKLLLNAIRANDIRAFKSLLDESSKKQPPTIDINYAYPDQSGETCLDMACKNGLREFVEYLVQKGAKVNTINQAHNRAPIHFATEKGHARVLEALLKDSSINPNLEAGQQTALHMAVKGNDLNCANLLLDGGASPNIPNAKGLTALHMAAMKGKREMVTLILQKSKHSLDLDTYKDDRDQTTRQVLERKLDIVLPTVQKVEANEHDLKYYLNANDETNFLKCLQLVRPDVLNKFGQNLLEMAVERNLRNIVTVLLEKFDGANCNLERAAKIAIQQSSPDILRQLLKNVDLRMGRNLILDACLELGMPGTRGPEGTSDRLECFKIILESDDVDVRCADSKGNTPLHYAARAGCREAITLLLEKGSYIGHTNNFGVPPVADIPASTLSQHFDDCLRAKKERTNNEYTIEFNYECLMPHRADTSCGENQDQNQEDEDKIVEAKREMDIFRYIASNSGLKHLLKHPLLSSFLFLKWRRIRHVLYINFAFYVLFYLLLNTYILRVTYDDAKPVADNTTEEMKSESTATSSKWKENLLVIFTVIALLFLTIRETLQLISSPCHYISNFENWLEMTLIILGFAIIYDPNAQLSAIAILLSAWELVILIGQHPRMSTGIEMFKTVSLNFMRFLFLYAFLILAFALAFFTLFKNADDNSFPDPGHSLFKTIIMLTGEFDASDIPFLSYPILSHLVFVLFVFLIAIVLFNLLNGLAVSDTVDILGKAELVGLMSRVKLVAYVENIAVPLPLLRNSNSFRCCCDSCRCSWFSFSCLSCNLVGSLAKRILLFPDYLKSGKLNVRPYDVLDSHSTNVCEDKCFNGDHVKIIPVSNMDPLVIKRAKEIIAQRYCQSDTERMLNELERVNERLALFQATLNSVKKTLENNNLNVAREDDRNN